MNFCVNAACETATRTRVKARDFEIIIDEPENLGGSNAGANPVEYVLCALCGCLNVVCHLIASEMNFTLNGLSIEVSGDLDPAKFMGQPTEGRAGFYGVHVALHPDCNADEATLQAWKNTVEQRCPVSDNISNITPVEIVIG